MKKISSMEKWQKASVIVGVVLSLALLVNTSLTAYITYQDNFKASIIPTSDTGESLEIDVHGSIGRPSPLRYYLNNVKDWISSYAVGGVEKSNAQTGITIDIDGANVASTASVDYYIEGVPQSGGSAYKFLEGTGSSVTVNGANLDLSNQTSIENHLTAMGLSTDSSYTIDYYVYVQAEATGAISGDTLTSEITRTKFDTVTYQYGTEYTGTMGTTTYSNDVSCAGEMILGQGADGTGYSPDYNGTLYRIYFKARQRDSGADDVCGTVYKWTSGGGISDLVAQSDDCQGASVGNWRNVYGYFTEAGEVSIYTTQTYWLGAWFEEDDSNRDWAIRIDYSPGAHRLYYSNSYRSGEGAPDPMLWENENTEFQPCIYVQYKYIGYDASWYPIGPVSVLAMPLGQALSGVMILAMLGYVAYRAHMEGK